MALKSTARLLQCKIEEEYENKVVISVEQSDQSLLYGQVDKNQLLTNLLLVEVIGEIGENVLVTWPIECIGLSDACCGGEIWVNKKSLI